MGRDLRAMSTMFITVNFLFSFFYVGMHLKVHKKYIILMFYYIFISFSEAYAERKLLLFDVALIIKRVKFVRSTFM